MKKSAPLLPARTFVLTLGIFLFFVALTLLTSSPPVVKGLLTKPNEFSAQNAQKTIKDLADMGPKVLVPFLKDENEKHKQAREYLIKRMKELGLSPQVQKEKICHQYRENREIPFLCFWVQNIVGRKEGTSSKSALMLTAHYDTADFSPGAADDAAGIATILEIIRILNLQGKSFRPILVLFTDGEEAGLLGAQAFVHSHPFAKEAGVVLNFEARGTQGQTALFQVSEGHSWLIHLYGREVLRPTSSSTIATLYHLLPNDTDLHIFLKAGMQGMNFAFADGEWNYHTRLDNVEHMDLRSVQDMGEQGLKVTQKLSQAPHFPKSTSEPNAVWFDLFTFTFLSYSIGFAKILAVVQAGIALFILGLALSRKQVSLSLLSRNSLQRFISIFAGGSLVFLLALFFQKWRNLFSLPSFTPWWITGGSVVLLGIYLLIMFWNRNQGNPRTQLGASVLVFTLYAVASSFLLSGISYLFVWPALLGSFGFFLSLQKNQSPFVNWLGLNLGFISAALFWVPLTRIFIIMGGYHLPSIGLLPLFFLGSFTAPFYKAWPKPIYFLILLFSLVSCSIALLLAF